MYGPKRPAEFAALVAGIEVVNQSAAAKVERRVIETFELIDANPGMGFPIRSRNPALAGIRFQLVKGYRQFVVVYRPVPDGVEVLRVVRGRRNLIALLEADE